MTSEEYIEIKRGLSLKAIGSVACLLGHGYKFSHKTEDSVYFHSTFGGVKGYRRITNEGVHTIESLSGDFLYESNW